MKIGTFRSRHLDFHGRSTAADINAAWQRFSLWRNGEKASSAQLAGVREENERPEEDAGAGGTPRGATAAADSSVSPLPLWTPPRMSQDSPGQQRQAEEEGKGGIPLPGLPDFLQIPAPGAVATAREHPGLGAAPARAGLTSPAGRGRGGPTGRPSGSGPATALGESPPPRRLGRQQRGSQQKEVVRVLKRAPYPRRALTELGRPVLVPDEVLVEE